MKKSIKTTDTAVMAEIIRQRRLDMGYSQQEVAVMVGAHIRQYQRLEYGERSMSTTCMKLGLAVCAVLSIDPFEPVFGDVSSVIIRHSQ